MASLQIRDESPADAAFVPRPLFHRLRNKLATVMSCTEWALSQLTADAPARESLRDVLDACRDAADLVEGELGGGSPERALRPLDVSRTILDCIPRLRTELPPNITLELGPMPSPALVASGSLPFERSLSLILAAAATAIGEASGSVGISVRVVEPPGGAVDGPSRGESAVAADGTVRLEIGVQRDGGRAFALSDDSPAFSRAQELARSHGGIVRLDRKDGSKPTLRLMLPAKPDRASLFPSGGRADAAGKAGIVLVVEDDDLLRTSQQRLLAEQGIATLCASSSSEALLRFAESRDSIHAMVLDLRLPDASGEKILEKIRLLRPTLPVIVATGDVTPSILDRAAVDDRLFVLPKPYPVERLLSLLRGIPKE